MLPFCCLSLTALKPKSESYPEHPETVGEHIRKHRMDRGLLQRQVAEQIGAHSYTLCLWELGRHQPEIRHWPGIIGFLGYDPHPEPVTFVEKLLAARRRTGLSQVKLAELLHVDPTSVGGWELGEQRPWRRTVERLEPILDGLLEA